MNVVPTVPMGNVTSLGRTTSVWLAGVDWQLLYGVPVVAAGMGAGPSVMVEHVTVLSNSSALATA